MLSITLFACILLSAFSSPSYALPLAPQSSSPTSSPTPSFVTSPEERNNTVLTGPHPFIHCPNPFPLSSLSTNRNPLLRDCQQIFESLFPHPSAAPTSTSTSLPPSSTSTSSRSHQSPSRSIPTFVYPHYLPPWSTTGGGGDSSPLFTGGDDDGSSSSSKDNGSEKANDAATNDGVLYQPSNLKTPNDSNNNKNNNNNDKPRNIYTLPQRYTHGTCDAALFIPNRSPGPGPHPRSERATWADIRAAAEALTRTCRGSQSGSVLSGGYVRVGERGRLVLEVGRTKVG